MNSTTNQNKAMPNYNKREHTHSAHTKPYHDRESDLPDPDDQERDTWTPNPEQYAAFAKRDFELGTQNVRHALRGAGRPITLKETKESSLHSVDVIERVMTSLIAAGAVIETKGRYSLVRP